MSQQEGAAGAVAVAGAKDVAGTPVGWGAALAIELASRCTGTENIDRIRRRPLLADKLLFEQVELGQEPRITRP